MNIFHGDKGGDDITPSTSYQVFIYQLTIT